MKKVIACIIAILAVFVITNSMPTMGSFSSEKEPGIAPSAYNLASYQITDKE